MSNREIDIYIDLMQNKQLWGHNEKRPVIKGIRKLKLFLERHIQPIILYMVVVPQPFSASQRELVLQQLLLI